MTIAETSTEQLRADLAEARQSIKQLKGDDARAEIARLEAIINQIGPFPIPDEVLRMHVGNQVQSSIHLIKGQISARHVTKQFGKSPEGPVLDWGCGVGRTRWWLDRHPAWREMYRGTDVDREGVAWLKSNGVANISLCSDTEIELPYRDAEMAGLFSFSVLTHIEPEKYRAWFIELRRILKPGSVAYMTFNASPHGRLDNTAHATHLKRFDETGQLWIVKAGHYKSAAFASHAFMRGAAKGAFEIEHFAAGNYGEMDTAICRAI